MFRLQLEISKPAWLPIATEPLDTGALGLLVDNFSQQVPIQSAAVTGSVAANGIPAIGWCQKLQVDDGKLWGYCKFVDSVNQAAAEEEQLSLVGVIDANAIDPTTGQTIGPRLRTIQAFPSPSKQTTEKKETLMTNISTQEQTAIFHHLPEHLQTAKTRSLAIYACVLEHIPAAARLTYDQVWSQYVLPTNRLLMTRDLAGKVAAGQPIRATLKPAVSVTSASQAGQRLRLDVSSQPGRNRFEKIIAHIGLTTPGLTFEEAHRRAVEMNRTHEVIG